MTPPPEFVAELRRFDPELRIRWGRHQAVWLIERPLPPRHRQLLSERPSPDTKTDRGLDVWEGWRDGYVHVLSVAPELLANRPLVFETLAEADAWRAGGMAKIADRLDAADAAQDAAADRTIAAWSESASREAWDRLRWLQHERIAVPAVDTGMGFLLSDRRRHGASQDAE